MSKFFIDHPVFAWVIAIILMLGGGLAIEVLPVAQSSPQDPPCGSLTVSSDFSEVKSGFERL